MFYLLEIVAQAADHKKCVFESLKHIFMSLLINNRQVSTKLDLGWARLKSIIKLRKRFIFLLTLATEA